MANLQNRSRILYFRVSEVEFQHFQDLCQKSGARNMSDMLRSAVQAMVRGNDQGGFEKDVSDRLQQLEISVARLSRAVDTEDGQT
jgi:hypothetical protein